MQRIKELPLIDFVSNENAKNLLNKLVISISKKYDLSKEEILDLVNDTEPSQDMVPVSIFIKELSALESIVKYLRETYNLRFCDIAKKLNRDQRTIWTTYAKSKKKHPVNLNTTYSEYFVPVKIFQERVYGVLEILVHYLKKHYNLKYSEIGKLLNRNQRTVWTVNSRYKKKEVEYA